MMIDFLLIGLMILLNGFFAMAEIAVIAAQPNRLRALVTRGEPKASQLLAIRENPGDFLATIQVGITLAGTIASVIGGAEAVKYLSPLFAKIPVIAPYSQEIALGLVVVIIAYLTLVYGELLPKRLAMRNAEKTALAYLPIRLLSFSVDLILRLFGKTSPYDPAISLEEIELVIKQGASDGVILPFEERLIHQVFDYADKTVSDVMTPRIVVIGLDVETPMVEALEKAKRSGFSRFPVFEQNIDRVVGYVHFKDLIWGIDKGINLAKCLREIVVIPENVTLSEAFSRLTKRKKHLSIILDEYGGTLGILTLEDLLEEIVGQIEDEHSPIAEQTEHKTEDEWIFAGTTPIAEVGELIGIDFQPKGLYTTLAGFMLARLGKIPQIGDTGTFFL